MRKLTCGLVIALFVIPIAIGCSEKTETVDSGKPIDVRGKGNGGPRESDAGLHK